MTTRRAPLAAALLATATTAVAAGPATAPASAAKPPTFKASVYLYQSVEWAASWTTPEICGNDYRHIYAGDGTGTAVYETSSAKVTFKRLGNGWLSSWFPMKGQIGRQAGYETGESGDPEGCLPDYTGKPDRPTRASAACTSRPRMTASVKLLDERPTFFSRERSPAATAATRSTTPARTSRRARASCGRCRARSAATCTS